MPPAAPDATAQDADRRLHPMSWLFVLAQQLKSFIVPLALMLLFGRGEGHMYQLWGLVGVGVLVALSLWQYFTYRYGIVDDALVVRSGRLERSLRVIPFARIHNVALQQTLLHRVFGVAEVRLESAGGQKPEAEMRVLKLGDALALEVLIRQRGRAVDGAAEESREAAPRPLLTLPLGELVRLGLISNRGMVVVAAAMAALSQFGPEDAVEDYLEKQAEQDLRVAAVWADNHHLGAVDYAIGAAMVLLALIVLVRLLSIALALLQFHGFTLSERGRRLTVERGLLARWRTSVPRRRIQSWTLRESLLHRLFRRRSLDVDTAVSAHSQQQRALRELAPIATPDACDALVDHLLPKAGWTALAWRAVPDVAWWRLFLPSLPITLLLTALACWRFGYWGLLVLLWLPVAAFKARQLARRIGYALGEELVAVREGWWSRHWRFAEIDKLQALQLVRTPLDRHFGTATLKLDTAGAGTMAPPLRIRFLPEADARALYQRLAHALAQRPLHW